VGGRRRGWGERAGAEEREIGGSGRDGGSEAHRGACQKGKEQSGKTITIPINPINGKMRETKEEWRLRGDRFLTRTYSVSEKRGGGVIFIKVSN